MPNHCDHDCFIEGPREEVEQLLTTVLDSTGALDANALIPYPEEFRRLDEAARAWHEANRGKPDVDWRQRPKDGFNSGGYGWCCANWGTKWGCYDGRGVTELVARAGRRKVKLGWLTAWSPALPVYAALAAAFPYCYITVRYYEAGMGFKGMRKYRAGALVQETALPYRGSRGG